MNEASDPLRLEPTALAAQVDFLTAPTPQTSYDEMLRCLEQPATDHGRVLALRNVHSAMTAGQNPQICRELLDGGIATADGMLLVGVLRSGGNPHQPPVDGNPSEMALAHGGPLCWHHFLVGATDETLERHTANTHACVPGAQFAGSFAKLCRPLMAAEEDGGVERVGASGTDLACVGLGIPSQQLRLKRIHERMRGVALLGVGAALGLLIGKLPQALDWIYGRGLLRTHRLRRQPRRPWRRCLYSIPDFTLMASAEASRSRAKCSRRD